jgi:hypothetical protein
MDLLDIFKSYFLIELWTVSPPQSALQSLFSISVHIVLVHVDIV